MEFNQAFDPIRALQSSWKALAQAPLPLALGGLLLILTELIHGGPRFFLNDTQSGGFSGYDFRPILFPLIGVCACVGIAVFLFASWIQVGFANTVESVLRTGHAEVGQLFDAKDRFGSNVLARLLYALIWLVCTLPFIAVVIAIALMTRWFHRNEGLILVLIPAFLLWFPAFVYVMLGVSLNEQAVALEGAQPVESLKRSWSLVSGHRWMLLLYYVVGYLATLVGFCFCCVGVIVTGSLVRIAKSESYLALVRGAERPGWWIEKGVPLPPAPQGWGAAPPPVQPV